MNRRLGFCLGAFLCVAAAVFVSLWFATRPTHRINVGTVEEIKKGMTLGEVEAILGVPAGDYSTRPVVVLDLLSGRFVEGDNTRTWTSNEASIRICFDHNECVLGTTTNIVIVPRESWWSKLRRCLRLE